METALTLAVSERDRDFELVEQARQGNLVAFDNLFERHRQFVYNICLGILGSSEDAMDATQNAFVQVYKNLRSFRGNAGFRTWIYRIATNISISLARKRTRQCNVRAEDDPNASASATRDRVWEAILEIPPDMRAVLVLFYFHGLSGDELAESLGYSAGAARTKLHRARKAFKAKYEELG